MNKILRALLAKKAEAVQKSNAILALAEQAGGDLTAEQDTELKAITASLEAINGQIETQRALIDAARGADGVTLPDAHITVTENAEADPVRGFATLGHFAAAVIAAAADPRSADARLLTLNAAAASTYGNEAVGADGGYLVPPQYASEILNVMESGEQLLPRCRNIPLGGNSITFPANETTAHGSTGVQAYWDSEAAAISQSKPAFTTRSIRLQRLTALVPVTEELLEDSAAMGAWINMEAGEKLAFKVTDAIVNGTGVGQPQGIVGASGTVSVAKETSQAAATVQMANIVKMWSRMPAASRARAVWLINQDLEPQLAQMTVNVKNVAGTENVGGAPAYFQAGSLGGAQGYASLMGRPVLAIESCQTVGTTGDIILADLSNYLAITKTGGIKSDQSIHLWFDQNLRAFRFVLRMNGMPWLSTPITRKNGSNTLGHFVKLDTRA